MKFAYLKIYEFKNIGNSRVWKGLFKDSKIYSELWYFVRVTYQITTGIINTL